MNRRQFGLFGVAIVVLVLALFSAARSCWAAENPLLERGKELLANADPLQVARGVELLGFSQDAGAITLLRPLFELWFPYM